FGKQRYTYIDDKAWLELPWIHMQFQPSEILKLALVLSLALHLEKARDSINDPKTLFFLCLHGAVPTLMVVAQGDHGTAMVFVAFFCCMLFAAGLSLRIVAGVVGVACAGSPLLWFFVLDNDKRQRVLNVWGPSGDLLATSGYQQAKGLMAIGSGQIWGKGVFTGEHQYIPEMYNDFIFAFAGEALGFVGCCAIIALLALLCLRLLLDARQAKDPLGRYICVGVFGILSFQMLWGIGMCLSLLPVTGLTLPFFSAGGTSVVMSYAAIGLAMSVHRHSGVGLFDAKT
ncbi:MAG: FtsW/RodA/SpoVE family cell cycle protein, partial [Oscillospiraceae bacterium]